MDNSVIEFISRLRIAGLQISPGEAADCLNAFAIVSDKVLERKNVMLATLVKRAVDMPVFEKVYAMYYGKDPHPEQDKTSDGNEQQSNKKNNWKDLFENLKQKNELALSEMVNNAVDSLGELKEHDAQNFNSLVRRSQIALEWFMAENQMERAYWTMPYDEWLEAKEQFDALKEKVEEAVRKKIEDQLGTRGQEELLKQMNWKEKDFGDLQDEELLEMEHRVILLGKRLASRISRRRKLGKKGIIDMRRLLKKAVSSPGGIPHEFNFLKRKQAKPKLAVLCDISGSVARYSRFMLLMMYILTNRFKKIKAYVFVDGISEITSALLENDWEDAFNKIYRESKCSNTGYSDYGKAFERFNKQYLGDIDNKTNIVILGDARNNWFPSGVDEFIVLSEKAKAIVWLNPQAKDMWDKDDSIIATYARYTSAVEECRNLEHLEAIVKKILAW